MANTESRIYTVSGSTEQLNNLEKVLHMISHDGENEQVNTMLLIINKDNADPLSIKEIQSKIPEYTSKILYEAFHRQGTMNHTMIPINITMIEI